MKIWLICSVLFFNYLIYHTYAQHVICNSIEGYDTKSLVSATQWQFTSEQCLNNLAANCTYYISFCRPAPMCFNEYSACQYASTSSNLTIIGDFSTAVFHENETVRDSFYAKFPNGPMQNISNTTSCEPSLIIRFNCKLDAPWLAPIDNATASAPEPTDIDVNQCLTTITFDYVGACSNKEKSGKNKIAGGSIFLIILFVVVCVYLIGGVLYNAFVKHQTGINLLPQAQFWIKLPLHAIEGCRATLGICSFSSQSSSATYESV